MYNVVHRYGHNTAQFVGRGDMVPPSPRARECLRKVLETLDERRSMFHRPTRWRMPEDPLTSLVPNGDASTGLGCGAVMMQDGVMEYFQVQWPKAMLSALPHISVLEAWTTVMIAFTWGHRFTRRKVVIRSDSKHACSSLNRLWAKKEDMAVICDLWEDIQFYFGFEGLVVYCDGPSNRWADAASRLSPERVEDGFKMQFEDTRREVPTLSRIPVIWTRDTLSCDVASSLIRINGG
jgi:hypothetical protein